MALAAKRYSPRLDRAARTLRACHALYKMVTRPNFAADYRKRQLAERQVAARLVTTYGAMRRRYDVPTLTKVVLRRKALAQQKVKKAEGDDTEEMIAAIADVIQKKGATPAEIAGMLDQLAEVAQTAGRSTTDFLGIEDGYDWTDAPSQFQKLYPKLSETVRQNVEDSLGRDAEDVAGIIVNGANPDDPSSIDEIVKQIRERIDDRTRGQITRLARTETARVYGDVAQRTMQENGIEQRMWLTANDSPIADTKPVCSTCLRNASRGWLPTDEPFEANDGEAIDGPPAHPWCRCDTAAYTKGWLPPKVPFDGNGDDGFGDDTEDLAASASVVSSF